jgi:hypothetical protein
MALHLFPTEEGMFLHQCEGEDMERVTAFPIAHPTLFCWSEDRQHVLAVDQGRKRVSLYRLFAGEFEKRMSPRTLPKGVEAHCLALKGSQVYVGDRGLWLPLEEGGWEQFEVPEFASGHGKRLDGLIVDGNRLIAVDNIVFPKWNLEYDIHTPERPVYQSAGSIPANYSYERIFAAAGGRRWFATLSNGVGRGGSFSFCTLFEMETLEKAFALRFSRESRRRGKGEILSLETAVFLQDVLCAACRVEGGVVLHWLDLNELDEATLNTQDSYDFQPPETLEEEIPELVKVHSLHACEEQDAVYLVGVDAKGEFNISWHPCLFERE